MLKNQDHTQQRLTKNHKRNQAIKTFEENRKEKKKKTKEMSTLKSLTNHTYARNWFNGINTRQTCIVLFFVFSICHCVQCFRVFVTLEIYWNISKCNRATLDMFAHHSHCQFEKSVLNWWAWSFVCVCANFQDGQIQI